VPPQLSFLEDAKKALLEQIVDAGLQQHCKMERQLRFTKDGMTVEEVEAFIDELLRLGASEPIVQTGGYYGVSADIDSLNTELAAIEVATSLAVSALSEKHQERAKGIYNAVLGNSRLRNRNPLHPHVIDACLIGNLLDFPKHLFSLPFACFATDGNEALSLLLYSYRQLAAQKAGGSIDHTVLQYGEMAGARPDVERVAHRLGLTVTALSEAELASACSHPSAIAVVTDFECPNLAELAAWAQKQALDLHVHVTDQQLRRIFVAHKEGPVHWQLPSGVRSMSTSEGILNSGFTLCRDALLRDLHIDVPLQWQTAYFSPNEGGSCAGRLLFQDLCTVLLGWTALAELAGKMPVVRREDYVLDISKLPPGGVPASSQKATSLADVLSWARNALETAEPSHAKLEAELLTLQKAFVGGGSRKLEGITTGGGTRSISLAFEAVLLANGTSTEGPLSKRRQLRVLTGNPHLAVERASRRFGFEVVRLDENGILSPSRLEKEVQDPRVVAIYSQTLSFTDGVTDPLKEILEIVEAENRRRIAAGPSAPKPVVLMNDCCLALNVLLQNDGGRGCDNLRILDLAATCKTPVIVTIDAHKHIGTDKGLSTVFGSAGALSPIIGLRKVGWHPKRPELIRALADIKLMGIAGYTSLYREDFNTACEEIVSNVKSLGMKVIHDQHRAKGSSVLAVEDPSGAVGKKLKKLGHSTGLIFEVCPEDPKRCQSGWQLSFTPHHLRRMGDSDQTRAIDVFLADLQKQYRKVQSGALFKLCQAYLKENSLFSYLLVGSVDPYLFSLLRQEGKGRNLGALLIRRFCSAQLDSGATAVTMRRRNPVRMLVGACGVLMSALLALVLAIVRRRRRRTILGR